MSYTFRRAIRTNTSVLIALAGSSGSGKTFSALRLARGLVGANGTLALIETPILAGSVYCGHRGR